MTPAQTAKLAQFCQFAHTLGWEPHINPQDCADLKRKLREMGVTYEIQCGRGIHGAIIGGSIETWAQGDSDEDALCIAVLAWLEMKQ